MQQVFQLNPWRAWGAVATTVASVSLSVYLIAISPWYLLPLAWAFAGTAWTGVCPSHAPSSAARMHLIMQEGQATFALLAPAGCWLGNSLCRDAGMRMWN